ncbi:PilZ domain-containing protein [Desulfonema magnum]|uniref:PilZ domain-containing protein n=1 Tax=Desulfonema magnum TaxID=45655 RepID=A0A975BP23_9BACT|nr:PilZ domain-containing protein [Desulfonema magnum]QTA88465.1 PilZ domain-containing protein [Desulfonema magnum]
MGNERRKTTRFLVRENAFATLGRRLPKIGRIRDISMGGLAFEYLTDYATDENENGNAKEEFLQAGIFLAGTGFQMSDIPCTVVYDIGDSILGNSFIIRKRCGIQFGDITERHRANLGLFIADYTTGLAPQYNA